MDGAEDEDTAAKKLQGLALEGVALAEETETAVGAALSDDLNTPLAIASLSSPLKLLNDFVSTKKGKKAQGRIAAMKALVRAVTETLDAVGLQSAKADAVDVLKRLRALTLTRAGLSREDVDAAVAARKAAREAKDFAESDRIRDELWAKGVALMDGGSQVWRPSPVVAEE